MLNTAYISKRTAKSLVVFGIVKTERTQWKEIRKLQKDTRKPQGQEKKKTKKRQYKKLNWGNNGT